MLADSGSQHVRKSRPLTFIHGAEFPLPRFSPPWFECLQTNSKATDRRTSRDSKGSAAPPASAGKAQALRNTAFLFIKPHAVTQGVKDLVAKRLAASGIRVARSGQIEAKAIDEKGLIDTHYGAIASRAMRQKAAELLVQPQARAEFEKIFGLSWDDALSRGLIFNAAEASEKLGVAPLEVSARFDKLERGKDF